MVEYYRVTDREDLVRSASRCNYCKKIFRSEVTDRESVRIADRCFCSLACQKDASRELRDKFMRRNQK